jgi:gluconolactonase
MMTKMEIGIALSPWLALAPVALAQDAAPASSRILAPGAQVEKLAGDFIFTEGPTSDKDGNVYLTTNRAVLLFDKSGQQIETIAVPEVPSNVCFGGADKSTLFITARTGFYAVKTRVHGVGPQ